MIGDTINRNSGAGRPSRRKSPKGGSDCQGLRLLVLQDGPLSIISVAIQMARQVKSHGKNRLTLPASGLVVSAYNKKRKVWFGALIDDAWFSAAAPDDPAVKSRYPDEQSRGTEYIGMAAQATGLRRPDPAGRSRQYHNDIPNASRARCCGMVFLTLRPLWICCGGIFRSRVFGKKVRRFTRDRCGGEGLYRRMVQVVEWRFTT